MTRARKDKPPKNNAFVILRLPEALREKLEQAAYRNKCSTAEAVRQAIHLWLQEIDW